MKKAFCLLLLMAIFIPSNAQRITFGSFSLLRDQIRVKLIVDFSEADIMGMTEQEFSEYEEDWEHDKVEIVSLFHNYANEKLKGRLMLGNYRQDTAFMLQLVVRTVDVRGNYDCDLYLLGNGENGEKVVLAKAEGLSARGGKFGSKLNLMKDGAEHTGTELGRFLLKVAK